MKSSSPLFLLLFFHIISFSQTELKIYELNVENGYIIYANNKESCPVSVEFNFNLKNLKSSKGEVNIFVIPAQTKKFEVTKLELIQNHKAYGFNYETTYTIGNHFLKETSSTFNYDLPFPTNKSYSILQGYDGEFSHQNKNALDFDMAIGSEILAIRDGVIIKVVDNNNRSCPTSSCSRFNNYIVIYHADGSFAEYAHIKYKGATVSKGQKIKKGDIIAYSGNTGWSSGPHLHLEVFMQNIHARKTLPVKFRINDGKNSFHLKKENTYLRSY